MDTQLAHLLEAAQYSVPVAAKEPLMLEGLNDLSRHHYECSIEYRRIVDTVFDGRVEAARLGDVPYVPVRLFKLLELKSIADEEVFKLMTSSGTTGQQPSRIYLDVAGARIQTQALSSIVTHYIGKRRLPMLIVDHPGVVKDRAQFSARGAGILGMLSYGRDHLYVLRQDMTVDRAALSTWLTEHAGQDLLIFGFTFMVWQYLFEPFKASAIDLSKATLVHSGGWKKLTDLAITNEAFKTHLHDAFGITRVHNFYGMVEQVGSVFFECDAGYFHPPNFADVIIRDLLSWGVAEVGQEGVVETLSLLPKSYPGHSLMTEDLGVVHGVDDCPCGRMGNRFTIVGRIPKAEIRGCSDA